MVKQLKFLSLDVAPVPLPGPMVGFPVLAGPAAGRGGVVLRGHGWRRGGWDHSGYTDLEVPGEVTSSVLFI